MGHVAHASLAHVSHGQWKIAAGLEVDEWVAFLAGLKADATLPPPPPMPKEETQAAFVGSSGLAAMKEGGEFYRLIHEVLRRSQDGAVGRLLDFGCGWGRISRFFLRDTDHLVGVDIDPQCIAICRAAMPDGNFDVCDVEPPLGFAEHSFDVVAAYSVFSHLAEHVFRRWMREFSRVLALVVTSSSRRSNRHTLLSGTVSAKAATPITVLRCAALRSRRMNGRAPPTEESGFCSYQRVVATCARLLSTAKPSSVAHTSSGAPGARARASGRLRSGGPTTGLRGCPQASITMRELVTPRYLLDGGAEGDRLRQR